MKSAYRAGPAGEDVFAALYPAPPHAGFSGAVWQRRQRKKSDPEKMAVSICTTKDLSPCRTLFPSGGDGEPSHGRAENPACFFGLPAAEFSACGADADGGASSFPCGEGAQASFCCALRGKARVVRQERPARCKRGQGSAGVRRKNMFPAPGRAVSAGQGRRPRQGERGSGACPVCRGQDVPARET